MVASCFTYGVETLDETGTGAYLKGRYFTTLKAARRFAKHFAPARIVRYGRNTTLSVGTYGLPIAEAKTQTFTVAR